MIIIIRGHVRNGFDNNQLYLFVEKMVKCYKDIKIYIHTWNIKQNNKSWRQMPEINTVITKKMIYDYFGDMASNIKHIIIDNDQKIKLIGNLEGNIGNTPMPIVGWKNYWYGKYRIAKYVYAKCVNSVGGCVNLSEKVINLRFDYFLYHSDKENGKIDYLYKHFIRNVMNRKTPIQKNIFMEKNAAVCCDNLYMGNVLTMYLLAEHFYRNMDDILNRHKDIFHQEMLVSFENDHIFNGNNVLLSKYMSYTKKRNATTRKKRYTHKVVV